MRESNGTTSTQPTAKSERKLKVFISYSRSDSTFADALVEELEKHNFEVIIDRRSLPVLEDWERELLGLIRAADTVVFIVSPTSLQSPVCKWEIDQVKAHGKRLAPVSLIPPAELSQHVIPTELARINFIFFSVSTPHRELTEKLAAALRTDRQWWLEHTRLSDLAVRWQEGGQKDHALLRGEAIGAAAAWANGRPNDAPNPPEVFGAFLEQSRAFDEEEKRRRRRIVGRAFVRPSAEANEKGEFDHAVRLAAAGALLAEDMGCEIVPELWPVIVWAASNSRTHRAFLTQSNGPLNAAMLSSDMKRLVTAARHPREQIFTQPWGEADAGVIAHIWNVETGKRISRLEGDLGRERLISMSNTGERLLTVLDKNIARIRDGTTGIELATLIGHSEEIITAAFGFDSTIVATGSKDKTARLWDATCGSPIACLDNHVEFVSSIVFNLGDRLVATTSWDNSPRIWNAATGAMLATLKGHSEKVSAINFCPRGELLVTASADRTARVWEAATGTGISLLKGHSHEVTGAWFSPDGTRVLTLSHDKSARVWDASSGKEIATLVGAESYIYKARF